MKKRFTLILASMLLAMGAWAQDAATYADGLYKVYWEADQRGYLAYHATDYPERPQLAGVVNYNPNGHYALDAEGINLGWYLYTSTETQKSYLFEATTGKFITIKTDEAVGNGKACVLSENVTAEAQFNLFASNGNVAGSYLLRYVFNGTDYHFCSGCGSNKGQNPVRFSADDQSDGGNRFVFVTDESLSITDDVKNAAIAKIQAFEKAAAEYEASFVKSVEEFDNNSLYTFISNRNAKDYMMYDAEYTNVVAWYKYQNLAAGDDVANCQWAVYKSENGNYYMYNIGAKKFLGTASANNAAIPFAETPQTMELMFKVTSVETHPIMISTNGGDGTLNHNSTFNNGVSNWDNDFGNDSDPGNVHKVRRVADISDEDKATIEALVNAFENTAIFEELTTLIMDAKVAIAGANNGVGTLTAEAAETLNEAVVAAEEVGVSSSYADIEAAISTLRSAYDAAEYIIVVPTAGKYYTFASANENKGDYENALVYAGEDNKLYWSNTKKATDAAAVWYYDGSVLKNVHTGCYINGFINNQPSPLAETGETVTFDQTIGKGQTKITVASRVMHTQDAQNAVVNWNSTPTLGSSSAFYVSEVDAMEISHLLNVSSVGWASLVLGYNATIPSGIKAYTVSSVANGYATLNEIDGVLPANTPVLLEATQGNYEFTFAESAASVGDNMLAGKPYHTYLTTVEGTTNYVLSVDANGENVGLYKKTVYDANTDTDASTYEAILFAANKAYLPVSTSSDEAANAISLNRGEGTTSIDNAQLTIDNVVIYDITGRRVEKMEKGIYIVNGKKIIK